MKLHLPTALLSALLACFAAPASAFVADGVLLGNEAESTRFYDNGKGYYWTWYDLFNNARTIYQRTGNWDFMGDLEERIKGTDFTVSSFDNLKQDSQCCWYNTAANVIQYWESYYGVFYTGSRELPYGYTYGKEYLETLAGTQSLDIDLVFYDNMKNAGGHLLGATRWYLTGVDDRQFVSTTGQGGYFADYFTAEDCCTYLIFSDSSEYSNYRPYGVRSLETELVEGFRLEMDAFGRMNSVNPGQLVYLALKSDGGVGHAVTCYGFETDATSLLTALYVTNSDDRDYKLLTLYVKESPDGKVYLFEDAACTQEWKYSDRSWFVSGIEYINTPQQLVDMYGVYADAANPLFWNGSGTEGWTSSYTHNTTEKLPGASAGWNVMVYDAPYYSYYRENCPVVFGDSALSSDVSVSGELTVPKMTLDNVHLNYTFNGNGAVVNAPLHISGTASAQFNGVTLNAGDLHYRHYSLSFGKGGRLNAGAVNIGWNGVLGLHGGSAALDTLTLGACAALDVKDSGTLSVGKMEMQSGSGFHLHLTSANLTSPLLSFTGSLTLGDDVGLFVDGTGLSDGKRYSLMTLTDGYSGNLADDLHCYSGSLTFNNNVLYLTYHSMGAYAWTKGDGTWSASSWNGSSLATEGMSVSFSSLGSGTVAVVGSVTPFSMDITGGTYTFTAGTANADLDVHHDLTISGGANVTTTVPLDPRCIILKGKSSLTFNVCGEHVIEDISAEAGTKLTFNKGSYIIDEADDFDCALTLGSGVSLTLDFDRDVTLGGTVMTALSSSLALAATDESVTYVLEKGVSSIGGALIVGGGTGQAALCVRGEMTKDIELRTNGVLELHEKGLFSVSAAGTGTLHIAPCGEQTFAVVDNHTTFAPTLSLKVEGTADIGTATNAINTALAERMDISGSLTVYFNHLLGAKNAAHTLEIPHLTLSNGGTLNIYSVSGKTLSYDEFAYYHAPIVIGNLNVGGSGGAVFRAPAADTYFNILGEVQGYSSPILIGRLTGEGTLFLQGSGLYTSTLYRVVNPGDFTGDIRVHNLAEQDSSVHENIYNMVALELGSGVLPGAVTVRTTTGAYDRCRAALGLMGDVTIGGLSSVGSGSIYLYSGRMGGLLNTARDGEFRQTADTDISDMLTDVDWRTLTLDVSSNQRFSGAVLSYLNLRKRGNGFQIFDGDMSRFTGSVTVDGGRLKFFDNVRATSVSQGPGTRLDVVGALCSTGDLSLHSAVLNAASVEAEAGFMSGTNTMVTDSLTIGSSLTLGLMLENLDEAILSLTSESGHGSLSIRKINIECDSPNLATGSYKLLEYTSDFGGLLEGVTLTGDCTATGIGTPGSSDVYFVTTEADGKTIYTLMADVRGGVLRPRKENTTLTWQAASGIWAVGTGHEEKVWSAVIANRNYIDGDAVVFESPANVTVSGTVTPASVLVQNNSGTVVFSGTRGNISGAGRLCKNGAGMLIIGTANSYTGGTYITGGSVTAGQAKALGTGKVYLEGGVLSMGGAAVANAIVATGGTLSGTGYKGALTVDGEVSVGAGFHAGSVTLNSGVLEGDISTAAVNRLMASGGSISGSLTLDGGLLQAGASPLTVAGNVLITGATALDISAYTKEGQYTLLDAVALEGDTSLLTYTAPSTQFGYALDTADGSLLLNIFRLTATHTWTAATGTWKTNAKFGADIYQSGDYVVFAAPATVTISGAVTPGSVTVENTAGTVTLKAANTSSRMAGETSLTKNGAGALVLNNGNTYTGGTTINAGTVTAGGVTSFGTGEITLNGGTLNLGKYAVTNPITVNGPANLKGTAYKGALTINADLGTGTNFYLGKNATLNSGTVKGVLTGAAGVSVKGEGTLAGKNTYKGTTAVQAGGLLHLTGTVAGNISVSGTLDSSTRTLTPASGKTLTVNNGGVVKGLVNVASGRTLVMKGTESSVDTINLNAGTAVFDSTAATQVFSGSGVFSFNGHRMALKTKSTVKSAAATPMTLESGSITLTSSKGYSGPITLNGGKLNLGSIALASPITVDGTANLIGSAYKGALTVNGTLAGSTNIYLGKTATLNGGTVKGILKGKGGVIVRGESTLTNKNTYTGTTNIQSGATLHLPGSVAGNIVVNSDATLDNTKAVSLTKGRTMKVMDGATVTGGITVGSGATLAVYGDESKLGSTVINGGTAVFDSTAAAVVGTGTAALTVHGKKITVKAKSTLKMAADEDITLRGGKLVLNSTSTTYTGDLLAQGGTLDLASRAVKNDVYLGNAVLMNGNALRGTLHVQNANSRYSGSLTLTSARKLDFEAGAKLTVTGTLTLKGGTALTLSGDDWEEGQYTIMTCGKLSGKAATAFKVTGAEGFDAAIRSSGKNIILTLTAIPEEKQSPELTTACETLAEPELTAAAEEPQPLALATEEEEETLTAEPDTYAAMQELAPTAEALVQSDWALVDTTRAFTASIRNRSMGTLTQDGKGAIWANAIGSFSRLGSVNGHSGSQTNVYGGSIGAEHVFGEHHTLGVALGSTHAMVGGTSLGKLRQNATHLALYGNSRLGSKFSADWAAAFGNATIHANMGANRGKWEQNSGELTARLTYTETLSDRTALRTYAGLDYDTTGADRVNGYKTGSVQALRGELGIGLTHATENAVLYAEIGMVGDMVRHNPSVESAHFRLQGANPGRTGFRATLGGSMKLNDTWSANAAYNLETTAHATQQSVNVGVSRKF